MNSLYGGVYIPNLANDGAKYGIGQYRFPHNYELVGKKIVVKADKEYVIDFTCGECAEFNGEKVCWEAVKLSLKLYFVRFGANCMVLCLRRGLAAVILDGAAPDCGVVDGFEPETPWTPAGDWMVGTNVRWTFGVNRYVNHDYFAEDKIRSAWSKNTVRIGYNERSFRDGWVPTEDDYTEEKATEIKIGDHYALVVIEADVKPGCVAPADMKRLVLLEDYDHMMTVGCAFTAEKPVMVTGYGMFLN
ncbi:MAG: hypothetical protein HUJ65_01660 [Oscillospiraceae bacterium]|nr:hypothetical protein [Oscillospiraceae bacterium]